MATYTAQDFKKGQPRWCPGCGDHFFLASLHKAMAEIGVDIAEHYPKHIDSYLGDPWDYVITVCGGANESCPVFIGKVGKRLHIGFDDPDAFKGTEEEVLTEFRRVRDEIKQKMHNFYLTEIKDIKIECCTSENYNE